MKKIYHPGSKKGSGRQWRKPYIPPVPAKPSVVRFVPANKLMGWDERQNLLFIMGDGSYHIFPAKKKAQSAIWHTVNKLAGSAGHYTDYRIEDA